MGRMIAAAGEHKVINDENNNINMKEKGMRQKEA